MKHAEHQLLHSVFYHGEMNWQRYWGLQHKFQMLNEYGVWTKYNHSVSVSNMKVISIEFKSCGCFSPYRGFHIVCNILVQQIECSSSVGKLNVIKCLSLQCSVNIY